MTHNWIYCDIETDGLDPTVIWCAVCKHKGVAEVICNEEDFTQYVKEHPECTWVFHNGIGFDVPVLNRLWNQTFTKENVVDTLVLSRLADPSKSGGHSLRNWGNVLGFPKGDHDDWTQLTPEMIDYCIQDVDVTEKVHEKLTVELDPFSQQSIDLEHEVQWIIQEQQRNGWLLDQRLAHTLLATFKERMNEIEEDMQKTFPPIVEERISEKTGKRLKDKVTVFNPGSRQQVAERLESKGAIWKELTPSGRPQVDERTLEDNKHVPEARLVLEYLLLQKRHAQVKSWLEHTAEDGRVHGRVTTNGAITGRMTHQSPNMAQVPASYSQYGHECRSCWIVPEGKKLVGFDASGLELRMLAHYMEDEEFTNVLLTDDIHTRNQMAAGLETRPQAKTFIYAFLYGAGDAKIGSIVGGTAEHGAELRERFLRNTPSLEDLRNSVGRDSQRGYLKGLDGRKLWIRSQHAALNTLLQAAGAIVMKQALVMVDEYAKKWNINYKFVGNIHDEIQTEVDEEQAETFGWLAVECLKAAGQHFELGCPLDGEYKVGRTWAETH
jgi:DNA polymerase I-like protein with 3'-5' exonuclease and polymerase domains